MHSKLAANATSHSPSIGYQSWPPMLPLTPLPSAFNAGYPCYHSLLFRQLSLMATNASAHSLTPALPSAASSHYLLIGGHQCYHSLSSQQLSIPATNATAHALPSHRLSMLATNATSHSPAIYAGNLSHSSHRLSMLGTNATSHSPPIG